MRDIIAAGVLCLIQIALVPIAAVGYVLWVVKIIKFSRESGASATVLASLYTRWMQHSLGTRRDGCPDDLFRRGSGASTSGILTGSSFWARASTRARIDCRRFD